MKRICAPILCLGLAQGTWANEALTQPLASPELVFEEKDGFVAVEAEHFVKQEKTKVRAWYLTTLAKQAKIKPDADPAHVAGAGGGAYLEILPDTRKNHGEKLIHGENFINEPGKMAILTYRVHFNTPGKYYVWARTHSTGTEDNGLHVGIDGAWPASGQRMQWTAKRHWAWASKQRTAEVHTGVKGLLFLEVKEAGAHTIHFSMREDGFEFDSWIMTTDPKFKAPKGPAPKSRVKSGKLPLSFPMAPEDTPEVHGEAAPSPLTGKREAHGKGEIEVTGELKLWHNLTFSLDGPFAHEQDNQPNPFTDYRFAVLFTHESAEGAVAVPGYFAADGNAAESSAVSGTKWRAHFVPDKMGKWSYQVVFYRGHRAALGAAKEQEVTPYHGKSGSFLVGPSDKKGRDLRGKGLLKYVGKHHLQFAGNKEYFLKAGADAPETFLGYADFDGTVAGKPKKVPLKSWKPHLKDWREGDPTWKNGKGKGMIGAINYLSGKGCNVFSFLTYNAGGDGDNVWPFTSRNDKLHYDCSKLDQWAIVFEHATRQGMYLHFKMQETEMDDNRRGHKDPKEGKIPTSLDGGNLGIERKLYCRELVARFGHNLALNWNLGEENTQTTKQQREMASYLAAHDPYKHPIVVHTYPNQQDKVYRPLLGASSKLRGASLQNSNVKDCHKQVVKWTKESRERGTPWVIGFDEPGTAGEGMPADPGYPGMPANFNNPSIHDTRKYALWGTLMAGGGGVEYYFGYKLPQNDLICEDWRSRDQSWDYCRIALEFFPREKIPFWEMSNADALVENPSHDNSAYCYAKPGEVYLVYLPEGGKRTLDLTGQVGEFTVAWFNPREGGKLQAADRLKAGGKVTVVAPDDTNDWLAVLRR